MDRKNRYNIRTAAAFLSLLLFSLSSFAQNTDDIEKYLKDLPFPVQGISVPVFPDRVVNIIDFGAVGDGQTMNTVAINKAIEDCASKGGGMVIVPAGLWLTGPIMFKSNINLHLEKGALVLFSRDHKDYPVIKNPLKRAFEVTCPISGYGLENIAITGNGIFDGSGETWRPVKKDKMTEGQWKKLLASGGVVGPDGLYYPTQEALDGQQHLDSLRLKDKKLLTEKDYEPARDFLRPYMVMFYRCKNILFDGPTFQNSPKFVLYPTYCENVVIRNINVLNEWWAQNGDGIDINGGSNVLIYNCMVNAGDDGICMKSSKSKDYGADIFLQNVIISDCVVYHAHGGFVIGSNTDGGMHNISVTNCNFIGTDVGLRFKSSRGRGGLVDNIFVSNIYMKDIAREAILFDTYYESTNTGDSETQFEVNETTPRFEKFFLRNIFCNGAEQAVNITGLPEMPVQDIEFDNITISARTGFSSVEARNIRINKVNVIAEKGAIYDLKNSQDYMMKDITLPARPGLFMKVKGATTEKIEIQSSELSKIKNSIEFSEGAKENSVKVK